MRFIEVLSFSKSYEGRFKLIVKFLSFSEGYFKIIKKRLINNDMFLQAGWICSSIQIHIKA